MKQKKKKKGTSVAKGRGTRIQGDVLGLRPRRGAVRGSTIDEPLPPAAKPFVPSSHERTIESYRRVLKSLEVNKDEERLARFRELVTRRLDLFRQADVPNDKINVGNLATVSSQVNRKILGRDASRNSKMHEYTNWAEFWLAWREYSEPTGREKIVSMWGELLGDVEVAMGRMMDARRLSDVVGESVVIVLGSPSSEEKNKLREIFRHASGIRSVVGMDEGRDFSILMEGATRQDVREVLELIKGSPDVLESLPGYYFSDSRLSIAIGGPSEGFRGRYDDGWELFVPFEPREPRSWRKS